MLYELWQHGGQTCFIPHDHPQKEMLTTDVPVADQHTKPWEELAKVSFTKTWEVEADSWEEACTKLHEHMGWEPYQPMEDGPIV